MSKAKDHLVRIILRDWSKSKTKKANTPVAETHTKIKKEKGD